MVLLIAGSVAFERSRTPPPASPQALERVGAKNEEAAMAAAARMKADSEAAARDADARLGIASDGETEGAGATPPGP